MNKISIIVPCFNEEESLPFFHLATTKAMKEIEDADYEIIFVDDGSQDNTLSLIKKLAEMDHRIRYIVFSRNFGKEAGMYAGLQTAKGDYCVIMDADLQHPPALLPQMYHAVTEEGFDCCGGKRKGRDGDGTLRSLLSKSFYKIGKHLTKMDMDDGKGDFRMMNRTMVDAILGMKEYHRYMKGLFSFIGFDTKWIEYDNIQRGKGETKWNLKSLFGYAMEGMLSFSTAPLKLAGIVGMMLLFSSIFVICIFDNPVLSIVVFLSGLQMIFLYIIGAYLSKDYMENKKRPIYIIKERG